MATPDDIAITGESIRAAIVRALKANAPAAPIDRSPPRNPNENDMSSEIEIPIWIASRLRKRLTVMAWARSADAPLACHNTVHSDGSLDESAWSITHRKTGRRVDPSIVYSKTAALALIDIYTPLADWDAITEPDTKRERKELIRAIEQAYEQFKPLTLGICMEPAMTTKPDMGTT